MPLYSFPFGARPMLSWELEQQSERCISYFHPMDYPLHSLTVSAWCLVHFHLLADWSWSITTPLHCQPSYWTCDHWFLNPSTIRNNRWHIFYSENAEELLPQTLHTCCRSIGKHYILQAIKYLENCQIKFKEIRLDWDKVEVLVQWSQYNLWTYLLWVTR